jgi:heme a synthase
MNPSHSNPPLNSQTAYRICVLLTICVFPLIWIGATVTTYAAGMAVPDWPGTYGYNMFLYPLSTWLFGPFNLLVEHGHRLLASVSGLITIALVIVTWRTDARSTVKWFSVSLLILIILQGALGGFRVLLDARTIARLHGCLGPAFFAMVVAFGVVTSRWWLERRGSSTGTVSSFTSFALVMLLLSYVQLCIGSFVRHVTLDSSPSSFRHLVLLHLVTACLLVVGTIWHWIRSRNQTYAGTGVRTSINWLLALVSVQFSLGLATYVVKYGWPIWFENWFPAASFIIEQKSMFQANIVTGHVAVGSLIIGFWMIQFLRSHLAIGRSGFFPKKLVV